MGLFFKLEEEEKSALLLLLPELFAEMPVFGSALGLGCLLVVAFLQVSFLQKGDKAKIKWGE